MTVFKASKKRSLEEVEPLIWAYFKRWSNRPVLIGQIATELKVSLAEAEAYLTDLLDLGVIREITPQEMRSFGVVHGFFKVQK